MSLILSERQIAIWSMYHDKGMTARDISAETRLSLPTVNCEIASARSKIDENSLNGKFLKTLKLRDVDEVLDEVDQGIRCKRCHLLFTERSTCTPSRCDARINVNSDHMPGILALLESMANLT